MDSWDTILRCNMPSYERPITVEEARKLLYRYATSDSTDADGVFLFRLNQVIERLNELGIWEGRKNEVDDLTPYITDHVLTLPYKYDTLVGIKVSDVPLNILPLEVEYSPTGPGHRDAGGQYSQVIDLGFTDVDGADYRSYKILTAIEDSTTVRGLLRQRFVYLSQDTDIVRPANIGALKHGLLAVCMEDEADLDRSKEYWAEALSILNAKKTQEHTGKQVPVSINPFGAGAPGVPSIR